MPVLPALLAADEDYAATFTKGDRPVLPRRRVTILTCLDQRLDPANFRQRRGHA